MRMYARYTQLIQDNTELNNWAAASPRLELNAERYVHIYKFETVNFPIRQIL